MKGIALIGVDCAAKKSANKKKNLGLALGRCNHDTVCIEYAGAGMKWDAVVEKLRRWVADAEIGLLAFDAPLGWPVALCANLRCHKAGKPLKYSLDDADKLFFRQTDLEILKNYDRHHGRRPFAVGADLIARTAHAALALLGELREKTDKNIRLAWTPGMPNKTQAIEVYPVVTLIAHLGKNVEQESTETKLQQIASKIRFDAKIEQKMIDDGNVFDAVLCVLAAADFVRGDVVCPASRRLAKKEGWIWVKPNQNHAAG